MSERPAITENPWFWIHLFAIGGLIALLLINNKADQVQQQRDGNFARRQHSLELQAGQQTIEADSSDKPLQYVNFTAFYTILGIIAVAAWVMLWRQHWRVMASANSVTPEAGRGSSGGQD